MTITTTSENRTSVRGLGEIAFRVNNLDATDLEALLAGKPVRQNVTVKAAVNKWLEFRSKNGLTRTKGKLMGEKLVAWFSPPSPRSA